jgi:predicted ABC-type ATPase
MGQGKTTFAAGLLARDSGTPEFINADMIAHGFSPSAPEKISIAAGKAMLREIHGKVSAGESFAFETTLSGRNYARHIPAWRKRGYRVRLIFLKLPSADVAVSRVKNRAMQGGHDVPESVIRRRFDLGWKNFEGLYRGLVDEWAVYDCAGDNPIRKESKG